MLDLYSCRRVHLVIDHPQDYSISSALAMELTRFVVQTMRLHEGRTSMLRTGFFALAHMVKDMRILESDGLQSRCIPHHFSTLTLSSLLAGVSDEMRRQHMIPFLIKCMRRFTENRELITTLIFAAAMNCAKDGRLQSSEFALCSYSYRNPLKTLPALRFFSTVAYPFYSKRCIVSIQWRIQAKHDHRESRQLQW